MNSTSASCCNSPQEALFRIYPNIFELLWHSMPPCSPSNDNPDSPHMLTRCSWLGNDVNCSDLFTPVVTDSGVCCSFNMQDNLVDSNYSRLVQAMGGKNSENTETLRKVTSGVGRGLEMVLDQNSHRSKLVNIRKNLNITGSVTKQFLHDSLVSNCSWVSLPSFLFCNEAI